MHDFLDHVDNNRRTIVVCMRCGRTDRHDDWLRSPDCDHAGDEVRGWVDTIVVNPHTGRVMSVTIANAENVKQSY